MVSRGTMFGVAVSKVVLGSIPESAELTLVCQTMEKSVEPGKTDCRNKSHARILVRPSRKSSDKVAN